MLLQSYDITDAIAGDFKDSFYPAGVQALMSQGRSYGLPDSVGPIVFWYNKELCEKAGVDPREIKYWEDFLAVEVALTDARECIVRAPFDGRVVGQKCSVVSML